MRLQAIRFVVQHIGQYDISRAHLAGAYRFHGEQFPAPERGRHALPFGAETPRNAVAKKLSGDLREQARVAPFRPLRFSRCLIQAAPPRQWRSARMRTNGMEPAT